MGTGSRYPERVLVIGCGFLGGHIALGVARRAVDVRVLSRSFAPRVLRELPRRALISGDARNQLTLERALAGIDEVVYCIGGLQPAQAELDPDRDASLVLAPLRQLVEALSGRPGISLTYLSSGGAVYGNPRHLPVTEDEPPKPIGAYAAARLAGEQIVARAHGLHGIPVRILRCANVYGEEQPTDRGQGAVGVFLDRISRGQAIEVFGDGSVVRDFVYVGDLVEVIARLFGRGPGLTLLNVGSGRGTSLEGLIALLEAALGRKATIVVRPQRDFDVRSVILDVRQMRRLLGVDPLTLSEGLRRLVDLGDPAFGKSDPEPIAVAL
jgi:UDP-glucose 4-epimerase